MIKINNVKIGDGEPPYIIAELSANHNGSLDKAKESIESAKSHGANAVKLQTYTADTMTLNIDRDDFRIRSGPWVGYTLYDLYKEAQTPYEWHSELFAYAREIGITIFSTPFDESAVSLLESLNAPAYKIASFEITDLPLISHVAKTGKPMLISTGMASELEITEAVETAMSSGCSDLLLFHCISSYPAPIESANLKQIVNLRTKYNLPIGLSDHTIGNTAAIASIALGACAIEKHFTLCRDDKGPDSHFSMEPNELSILSQSTHDAWLALGKPSFERPIAEQDSKVFRRSIYFTKDMKAGEKISAANIRRIRPGFGLDPKFYNDLIGSEVLCDVYKGDRVSFDLIKKFNSV